jgi:hypothetical protein
MPAAAAMGIEANRVAKAPGRPLTLSRGLAYAQIAKDSARALSGTRRSPFLAMKAMPFS